jgi:hypothetical protein
MGFTVIMDSRRASGSSHSGNDLIEIVLVRPGQRSITGNMEKELMGLSPWNQHVVWKRARKELMLPMRRYILHSSIFLPLIHLSCVHRVWEK